MPRKLKVPESAFKEALKGKELHFVFKDGHVLGFHLMLHGTMYWYERQNENRFTVAELLFADGTGLAITDWQKAVMLKPDPVPANVPDAMALPDNYLARALKEKPMPSKPF